MPASTLTSVPRLHAATACRQEIAAEEGAERTRIEDNRAARVWPALPLIEENVLQLSQVFGATIGSVSER